MLATLVAAPGVLRLTDPVVIRSLLAQPVIAVAITSARAVMVILFAVAFVRCSVNICARPPIGFGRPPANSHQRAIFC
ncbi:protein of unknown function [Nitratireductor aquimarinus]